jgi:hypothetical protein
VTSPVRACRACGNRRDNPYALMCLACIRSGVPIPELLGPLLREALTQVEETLNAQPPATDPRDALSRAIAATWTLTPTVEQAVTSAAWAVQYAALKMREAIEAKVAELARHENGGDE